MPKAKSLSHKHKVQAGAAGKTVSLDNLLGYRELASAVLDGLLDGIVLVNMHGEVVYVNKAFEKMLGYKADELVGRSTLELPTYRGKKENADKAAAIFKQVSEKGFADPIDMYATTKKGDVIPLSFTASVIKDNNGHARIFVAVVRDVTERKKMEEALRQNEQVSTAMVETAGTGIYLLQDGCFQYVNRLFEVISGYSSEELIEKHSLDYVHPDDRERVRMKAIEVLKGQSHQPYQFRFIRKDGEIAWVLDRLVSIQLNGKRSVLGSLMDISDIKKAEEKILDYTKQLETLFDIGIAASRTLEIEDLLNSVLDKILNVMGFDAGGIFLFDRQTNELLLRVYRGTSQKFVKKVERMRFVEGFTARRVLSGKPLIVPYVELDPGLVHMGVRNEGIQSFAAMPIMAKDQILGLMAVASRSPRQFSRSAIRLLTTINNQIGMAIDNARLYEHALQLAFTDTLTGLYNRRYLLEEMEREFARVNRNESSLSLIMMDMDGLKSINDRFGHVGGDTVLRELGRIIKRNTRASDVAARWGGDEFVVLAPDTDSKNAYIVGERIRAQVERCRPKIAGVKISISVSVGIASYPAHASSITELVKVADQVMYNAKGLGKNQVCVYSKTQAEHVTSPRRSGHKAEVSSG